MADKSPTDAEPIETDGAALRGQSAQLARRHAIAELVFRRGSASMDELVTAVGVSLMTLYRDIAALEEAGILTRHRGKVSALASGLHEAGAGFRLETNVEAKAEMAALVARMIAPGSSILLDDSTSGAWVLRALHDLTPLTVITNSLLVAREVSTRSDVKLLLTGGEYQAWADAMLGPTALAMLATVRADYCLLSASGLEDGVAYHPYQDVAEVKRAMLRAGRRKVLMLDHTKFARRALHAFADLGEFDTVLVDHRTSAEDLQMLARHHARVMVSAPLGGGATS
ncbi:DeoR/GlpR family DNA-binding transcription regulator [Propionibacteriaceae bacterium G1746]